MVAITEVPTDGSPDDLLDALELALEAIDELRLQLDEQEARRRSDVARLHHRVEEIAVATWKAGEDDRLQRALDAIDDLRRRVDDADPSEAVLRTLDTVTGVAGRLDADDTSALAELTLEAVRGLRDTVEGDDTRAVLDRAIAAVDQLRARVEDADPGDALELMLQSVDDLRREVEARDPNEAIEVTLEAIDELDGRLAGIEGALAAAVAELGRPAPAPVIQIDERMIEAIADRVAGALVERLERALAGSTDRVLGRLDASTDRVLDRLSAADTRTHDAIGELRSAVDATRAALPSAPDAVGPGSAVVASAAAAMSRLEGRLDSEFGAVERGVELLDQRLSELDRLVREIGPGETAAEPAPPPPSPPPPPPPPTGGATGRDARRELNQRLEGMAERVRAALDAGRRRTRGRRRR